MPPQLLSRVKANAGVALGPGFLGQRPQLAALVAEVIGIASEIDLQEGRYLASLLGADQVAGVAMFLAITGDRTRRDVISAASKAKLTDIEFSLFERAFQTIRAVENERNAFAHQLWGITDDIPDALLLVDPEYRLSHMMDIEEKMKGWHADVMKFKKAKFLGPFVPPPPAAASIRLDPSKIRVYREADLRRSRDRALIVHRFIHRFADFPRFPVGAVRDQQRVWLLDELDNPQPPT